MLNHGNRHDEAHPTKQVPNRANAGSIYGLGSAVKNFVGGKGLLALNLLSQVIQFIDVKGDWRIAAVDL